MSRTDLPAYDGIVLTGGRASRLGGVDKSGLLVGDRTLGARVLAAIPDARRVIVVGRAVPSPRVDRVISEEPPGAGPVAAVAAGLAHVRAPVVAVLAGDLPFLDMRDMADLRAALESEPRAAASMLVDGDGRDQPLCATWRTGALRAAVASVGGPAGVPMRAVVAAAGQVVRRGWVAQDGRPPWFDCDTDEDLRTAREWAT